ncbi:hypothetical protein B296_00045500, partial [Ensete ventricosum]
MDEEEDDEKKKKEEVTYLLSPRRLRPRTVLTRGRFFSHVRRQNVSPCGEKDRGDIAEPAPSSPTRRPCPQAILLLHEEKDRGD